MDGILKAAHVEKAAELSKDELALINQQTLRALTADEVFVFRLAACGNQVDRDYEQFADSALEKMAELYVGKPVLMDHKWSAGTQTARVYAAEVEDQGDVKQLILRCYMPRTPGSAETIAAIEGGVLRECSVGVTIGSAVCSVCGADQMKSICRHIPGREYDGKVCSFMLDDVGDAYEVSLVAVPAQPEAGTIKSKRYGGANPSESGNPSIDEDTPRAKSLRLRLRAAEAKAKAAGCGQTE